MRVRAREGRTRMIPLLSRTAITPRIIETIVVTDQLHTPSHYASEWRSQSVATCCERVVESSRAFQSGCSSFAVDSRVQVVNTPSRCKEEERGEELEKERETRKEEREREKGNERNRKDEEEAKPRSGHQEPVLPCHGHTRLFIPMQPVTKKSISRR